MIKRNKKSADYVANHTQDVYTDLGHDYRDDIFNKSLSPIILNNEKNKRILSVIQKMIVYLVDAVKQIKLHFMISLDKTDRNLN